ncbi:helix-turn-helix transcriptional regulator [Brevundimonas nasdae]|uniref:Helix-turn-helix transcriptional regulator n=1 Tax=Brevundimonas nasdae TaxID=172043 RepID=A0ABX8TM04_9CAUL|nr:helix-turn-helix transcriptional regulator [Brevundimonas nasdae]MBK6023682.1 helix-turn-helix transcriptional regulator [Brevundimonas nasdae]QYC12248.1 helix-turn-helix transcriptional regulator [Brevundimonas nasdae]QYC15797.1 helix-turn-helix transcriptional regulator [Brevundimonas nasdae]
MIVRLKEVRTAAGLTQQELADRAGVSRKTVNTIENRIFTPSVVVALTLAKALDAPLGALFELSD